MKYQFFSLVCLYYLVLQYSFCQISLKDSCANIGYFHFGAGIGNPAGSWSKKYGIIPQVGLELGFKSKKNWSITGNFGFIYTDKVKIRPQLFQDIDTFDGLLIDTNGELVFPDVTAQGWAFGARFGKTFSSLFWKDPNPNSGIFIEIGYLAIRHKLNIQVPQTLPIMLNDYLKGYDRLTLSQGTAFLLGYRFFNNKRLLNFTAYMEFDILSSKNLRGYNYDTRSYDNSPKLDVLSSIKIMWCLPLYQRAPESFYYY
ncbi:MAG: hypothetical protein QXU40_04490 [Candidatus Pacearchaeota archaeon]